MEGEKETAEEKEEEEDKELHHHIVAASSVDYPDLPIMHWEELSQRIAELEQQEQERRDRSKREKGKYRGEVWRNVWEEDEDDLGRCRVTAVASRFQNSRNLQLCFINNSDSEEEEEEKTHKKGCLGHQAAGLKQEVVTDLRTLRDKLLAEQKEKEHLACCGHVAKRKHLEHWELQECSEQQLSTLMVTLQQEVHALSSELVAHLLVRDQLRTKQDAMLLDVQDLT